MPVRAAFVSVAFLVALGSCLGTNDSNALRSADASLDARQPDASASDARRPGIATRDEPERAPVDARLDAITLDSTLPPECEGGTPPRPTDAPRPACIPPCLWEVVKDCPPPAACEQPRPGRREVHHPSKVEVYLDDRLCYTTSYAGSHTHGTMFVYNPQGQSVTAFGAFDQGYVIACEPCTYRDGGWGDQSPSFLTCGDGGLLTAYRIGYGIPKCAP